MESLSPLAYQMSLHFRGWFSASLVTLELVLLLFKARTLPFPAGNFASEVVLLFMFSCLEAVSLHTGRKGNLTRKQVFLFVSFLLSAPSVLALLYLLLWQTYVLRLEVVLLVFALGVRAVELALAFGVMVQVGRVT